MTHVGGTLQLFALVVKAPQEKLVGVQWMAYATGGGQVCDRARPTGRNDRIEGRERSSPAASGTRGYGTIRRFRGQGVGR